MKTVATIAMAASFLLLAACGDMSNRSNEDHSQYTDSAGMNPDAVGYPNTSTAPMRDSFATGSASNTSGPDNAAPKSSAADSSGAALERPAR